MWFSELNTNTSINVYLVKTCLVDGQRYHNSLRRLGNDEYPLVLWLQWTEDIDSHQFVLQNNFTNEIAVSVA
jgi:hypothetical protein